MSLLARLFPSVPPARRALLQLAVGGQIPVTGVRGEAHPVAATPPRKDSHVTHPKKPWVWCNQRGCDTKLTFARPAGTTADAKRRPYEYDDVAPFSPESIGCHVLIAGEAWNPLDLIEDFQVRLGISETKARELVTGYPFHRPHRPHQVQA